MRTFRAVAAGRGIFGRQPRQAARAACRFGSATTAVVARRGRHLDRVRKWPGRTDLPRPDARHVGCKAICQSQTQQKEQRP
jgi:hypothetical protein